MVRRRSYVLVTFCCFLILVFCFGIGYYINISKNVPKDDAKQFTDIKESRIGEKEVLENSTVDIDKNNDNLKNQEVTTEDFITQVNLDNQKQRIGTSTKITFKRKYLKCGHEQEEVTNAPEDIVNYTEKELKQANPDWEIEKFDNKEVIISIDIDALCPEHYLVKEYQGEIGVFYLNPVDGNDLKQIIDINVAQLRQDDREKLKQGIQVDSEKELVQLIEDFIS